MTPLILLTSPQLPALISAAGDRAGIRFLEFFAAQIRNPHTRRAYARAADEFLAWCADAGVPSIAAVQPVHVATWIEASTRTLAAPSVKQRLAALRHLFDWLVNGQVVPVNPAHTVRGPRHVVTCGQTPVLDPAEARALLDSIDVSTHAGLRDRALIGLMVYSFARIGAALGMAVEDVYTQNRRLCCKALGVPRWKARARGGRAVSDFKGRHFGGEIVLWAVRWYCRYGISYRDLEQMMAERGVWVDHSTIYRWVQRYAPEIEKRLRWHWRRPRSGSWRVDEIYVKVRGKWSYLYRAVDKLGNTIDFYLSPTRTTMAAKRFLGKALRGLKDWEQPEVINTDKAPTYAAALTELKAEGKCPQDTQHRQVKYLNNIVEADHGKLKQLIRPVRGFKSMKTAYATIKGFEVMRALRKGQAAIFNLTRDIVGEARLVERAFGLGPCALTEAVQLVGKRLEAA